MTAFDSDIWPATWTLLTRATLGIGHGCHFVWQNFCNVWCASLRAGRLGGVVTVLFVLPAMDALGTKRNARDRLHLVQHMLWNASCNYVAGVVRRCRAKAVIETLLHVSYVRVYRATTRKNDASNLHKLQVTPLFVCLPTRGHYSRLPLYDRSRFHTPRPLDKIGSNCGEGTAELSNSYAHAVAVRPLRWWVASFTRLPDTIFGCLISSPCLSATADDCPHMGPHTPPPQLCFFYFLFSFAPRRCDPIQFSRTRTLQHVVETLLGQLSPAILTYLHLYDTGPR